ncbi:MAG: sugar phosphate isomerase/epimerase [Gemmataceae bacterium]
MRPCLSGVTIMPASFAEDVAYAADAGCAALEVWLPKLENHLETHGLDATRKLLAERGVTLPAAAFQGGLLLSQGEKRKAAFDHFRTRLDLCQALGIPTLIVVPDFVDAVDAQSLERAVVSLKQAAQWAAGFDVRLALEFQAKGTFCACLETACALIHECDEPNVGVNLDVFHYYTGPSKPEDFALAPERLFHVQFCDLSGVPRELATDADRILPGDGDFRFDILLEALRGLRYDGWVALELMNPQLWRGNLQQVAEIGVTALRKVLGLAAMTDAGR